MTGPDERSVFSAQVWAAARSKGKRLSLREAVLRAFVGGAHEQLTVWTVLAPGNNPLGHLASASSHADATVVRRGQGFAAMLVTIEDQEPFVVTSWTTDFDGVHHLAATIPVTDRRWKRVERWVRAAAPNVSTFYLDREQFSSFVSALGQYGSVSASRLTSRRRSDRSSDSKGYPRQMPAMEALVEVEEGSQVRTMTLSVVDVDEADLVLRVHLRRLAGATFYNGSFEVFDEVILHGLARTAAARLGLLQNRSRPADDSVAPQPLVVRLDTSFFSDLRRTADVIDRLGAYSRGEVAVMHRNPYLHLAVADYTDGSNYDVFVTEADEIVIYGGYKASVGSLARLTEYLSEEFAAQEVAELPRADPVSLEDLFTAG